MEKNIAVIGSGYWGKNLVRNFAELHALHTICDSDLKKLESFKPLYPDVVLEPDYQKVLGNEKIRGVVIASPAVTHHPIVREALEKGKDIMVEKPLALQAEEGKELVELAEKKGKILLVGHLLLYHPAIDKLRDMIDKGELGNIEYIYSNRLNLENSGRKKISFGALPPTTSLLSCTCWATCRWMFPLMEVTFSTGISPIPPSPLSISKKE